MWINVGRSVQATSEKDLNGNINTSKFLETWRGWASEHEHEAAALASVPDYGFTSSPELPTCSPGSRIGREAYPSRARLMGFDSVQMGYTTEDGMWRGARHMAPHPQVVVVSGACGKDRAEIRACPHIELRAGSKPSVLRECKCKDDPKTRVINCNGHAAGA